MSRIFQYIQPGVTSVLIYPRFGFQDNPSFISLREILTEVMTDFCFCVQFLSFVSIS